MAAAVWEYLDAIAKYDGAAKAHEMVIETLKKHGHTLKKSSAWCSETQMAALYDCGAVELLGGFSADSGSIKSKAQKKGIWHSGSSGILPGDIVLFGSSGKPNHTEGCVGYQTDVSGNYKGGCSRRSYKGRSIVGYARPKWAVKEMDNLQVTIAAVDCILGVYGSGKTREKMLAVFGSGNAAKIQAEVDRISDSMDRILFDMAVYVIAGHAGKGGYRIKRLGNYAERVQDKVDAIKALHGGSIDDAVRYVLDGKFGTNAVRRLLLAFCGYDADKVQDAVNKALSEPETAKSGGTPEGSVIFLFRGIARSSKDVDGLQGDCWICRSGTDALIGDTMRDGALDKIKAEVEGCTNLCLYFSHEHSDHMSGNANKLIKQGIIKKCYVPAADIISKDSKYQTRYKQLIKDCNTNGVEVIELRKGSKFDVGPNIHGEVIHLQAEGSDSINMHSLCTMFTVAGETYLTCGDHHCGEKDSKFKPPGHVKIYKSSHHQLFTGDGPTWVGAISPEWIVGTGWQSWPNATVGQDAKTKRAQKAYQAVGNLLPGDVCGRVELTISGGVITAKGEKGMVGKTVKYSLNGKTYQKTVHVCEKAAFRKVASMIPRGAKFV